VQVGFMLVDALAGAAGIDMRKLEKSAAVGRGEIRGRKVILAKPVTFMNNTRIGSSTGTVLQGGARSSNLYSAINNWQAALAARQLPQQQRYIMFSFASCSATSCG